MEVMYPRCAGLDVHKETVVACVRLVEGGKISHSVRTFATTTANLIELGEWLEANGCTHVAMEATGVYWKPVWQVLAGDSFELVLANAAHVKNVPGRKTDVNDATWLSELLAHGLVRASFVPKPEIQELRGLLRTRKQLVREKASHIQRLQKTLEEANIKLESVISDIMGHSGRTIMQALIAGETDPAKLAALAHRKVRASQATLRQALHGRVKRQHRFLLRLHLQQIDALDASIAEIDREVDAGLACFRDAVKQLITIPGVSDLSAHVIISEIGTDMSRFATDAHLRSWAGLCPRNDESAGKRRSTRLRRGSHWLKTMLVQCAWASSRSKAAICKRCSCACAVGAVRKRQSVRSPPPSSPPPITCSRMVRSIKTSAPLTSSVVALTRRHAVCSSAWPISAFPSRSNPWRPPHDQPVSL
jgi:transposase